MRSHTNHNGSHWLSVIVIGLSVMVLSSSPSWACGHKHAKHPDASDFIRHVLMANEALGLTEEQATRLHTLKIAFKKDRITKKADVDLATVDMHAIQHDDHSSMAESEGAVKTVYTLKGHFHLVSVKTRQEANSVLNSEQQEKMKTIHRDKNRSKQQDGY